MARLKLKNSLVDKRYEILEHKAQGSYAEIFLARDRAREGRLVIIKALNTSLQGMPAPDLDEILIEYFQNEAFALTSLHHPNIIRLLGRGTDSDQNGLSFPYLVLEFLAGGDLQQKCRRSRLNFPEVMNYVRQICDALSYLHQCGVIHRDIKPGNLLLSADGQTVKIADFSIARTSSQADEEGPLVGTDFYSPPEHHPLIAGGATEPVPLLPSSDVYSLAKSIYTLLSGHPPCRFRLGPITQLPADLRDEPWTEGLLAILRRATDSRIEKRYASAASFYQDLETVQAASQEVPHVRATHAGRIVIQLPQRQLSIDQAVQAKKSGLAAIPETHTKVRFLGRADSSVLIHRKRILAIWGAILFLSLLFSVFGGFRPAGLQDQGRPVVTVNRVIVKHRSVAVVSSVPQRNPSRRSVHQLNSSKQAE